MSAHTTDTTSTDITSTDITSTDITTGPTTGDAPRSSVEQALRGARLQGPRPSTGVPFARLTLVELRKQLDTRAGRWLLIVIAVVALAAVTILFFVEGGNHAFGDYLGFTAYPIGLLVPIIGILAATSEWSQRTALVTFTLEPRRVRVALAKMVSSVGTGLASVVVSVALAAAVTALAVAVRGADSDWSVPGAVWAGLVLFMVLGILQGVAFGLVLLNTPAAIVAYFVLPTVWTILWATVSALRDAAGWLDLGATMEPLMSGDWLSGDQWARLATSVAVWVVLPLLAGIWRITRSEVKSA